MQPRPNHRKVLCCLTVVRGRPDEIAIFSIRRVGVCLVLKALNDVQGWMNDRVSYLIYLLLFLVSDLIIFFWWLFNCVFIIKSWMPPIFSPPHCTKYFFVNVDIIKQFTLAQPRTTLSKFPWYFKCRSKRHWVLTSQKCSQTSLGLSCLIIVLKIPFLFSHFYTTYVLCSGNKSLILNFICWRKKSSTTSKFMKCL